MSGCEALFEPLSSDKEGHLRGGFVGIEGSSYLEGGNKGCQNTLCNNVDCKNNGCKNIICGNTNCNNIACISVDVTEPATTTTTIKPSGGYFFCGLL